MKKLLNWSLVEVGLWYYRRCDTMYDILFQPISNEWWLAHNLEQIDEPRQGKLVGGVEVLQTTDAEVQGGRVKRYRSVAFPHVINVSFSVLNFNLLGADPFWTDLKSTNQKYTCILNQTNSIDRINEFLRFSHFGVVQHARCCFVFQYVALRWRQDGEDSVLDVSHLPLALGIFNDKNLLLFFEFRAFALEE